MAALFFGGKSSALHAIKSLPKAAGSANRVTFSFGKQIFFENWRIYEKGTDY